MMILVVTLAATLSLSNAQLPETGLPDFYSLSSRQASPTCGGITIPLRCIQAQTDYEQTLQQIFTNLTQDTGARLESALATYFGVFCSDDCLRTHLAVDACENNGSAAFARPGVHNQPRLLKSRSVNRPRFNWIFCQRTVASGYTIFSAVRPHLLEHGQPESNCMYS